MKDESLNDWQYYYYGYKGKHQMNVFRVNASQSAQKRLFGYFWIQRKTFLSNFKAVKNSSDAEPKR